MAGRACHHCRSLTVYRPSKWNTDIKNAFLVACTWNSVVVSAGGGGGVATVTQHGTIIVKLSFSVTWKVSRRKVFIWPEATYCNTTQQASRTYLAPFSISISVNFWHLFQAYSCPLEFSASVSSHPHALYFIIQVVSPLMSLTNNGNGTENGARGIAARLLTCCMHRLCYTVDRHSGTLLLEVISPNRAEGGGVEGARLHDKQTRCCVHVNCSVEPESHGNVDVATLCPRKP